MKLNVNFYFHLPNSTSFPMYKKLNNWNLKNVLLAICGCLLVVCGGLLIVCGLSLAICDRLCLFVVVCCRLWSLCVLVPMIDTLLAETFRKELLIQHNISFHEPIKRNSIATFKDTLKSVVINKDNQSVTLPVNRNII